MWVIYCSFSVFALNTEQFIFLFKEACLIKYNRNEQYLGHSHHIPPWWSSVFRSPARMQACQPLSKKKRLRYPQLAQWHVPPWMGRNHSRDSVQVLSSFEQQSFWSGNVRRWSECCWGLPYGWQDPPSWCSPSSCRSVWILRREVPHRRIDPSKPRRLSAVAAYTGLAGIRKLAGNGMKKESSTEYSILNSTTMSCCRMMRSICTFNSFGRTPIWVSS